MKLHAATRLHATDQTLVKLDLELRKLYDASAAAGDVDKEKEQYKKVMTSIQKFLVKSLSSNFEVAAITPVTHESDKWAIHEFAFSFDCGPTAAALTRFIFSLSVSTRYFYAIRVREDSKEVRNPFNEYERVNLRDKPKAIGPLVRCMNAFAVELRRLYKTGDTRAAKSAKASAEDSRRLQEILPAVTEIVKGIARPKRSSCVLKTEWHASRIYAEYPVKSKYGYSIKRVTISWDANHEVFGFDYENATNRNIKGKFTDPRDLQKLLPR